MLPRSRTYAGGSRLRGLPLGPIRAALALALALALAALALALAATGASSAAAAPPATSASVPQGFVGMDVDGPLLGSGTAIDVNQQVATMVANGVQSIRVAFNWAAAEPYQSWADVPAAEQAQFTGVSGRPLDFQATDVIVGDAARHGVSVLPTVLYAPSWDARTNPNGVATPQDVAPYAGYLTALIGRYGPHGSFWSEHPGMPRMAIRMWQVWNEPNISYYWPQPFAAGYVALLRAAHTAVKRADPGAQVVLGALTNLAWESLGQLYRVPGARGLFDVVAVNGFTKVPADVITYLRLVRNAMARLHDGLKPLLATEISWPSALGKTSSHYDFDTTAAGQAGNIAALLPLIGQQRASLRLAGFDYYTWMGQEDPGTQAFNFAGLLGLRDGKVTVKPALAAFRAAALALEHCRRKGPLATSCVH